MGIKKSWIHILPLVLGSVLLLSVGWIGFHRHGRAHEPARSSAGPAAAPETQNPEAPATGDAPRSTPSPSSASPSPPVPGTPVRKVKPPPATPESPAERFRARVLDENEETAVRVRDLISLRQVRGVTPEAAESMLKLIRRTGDDIQRSRILLGLEGVKSDEVKAEMINRLKADASPRVRKAAATALFPLRDDPEVKAALEFVRENDRDEDVRRASHSSLTRPALARTWGKAEEE